MDAEAAADQLLAHRRAQDRFDDLPAGLRPADLAEAYATQDALVRRLVGPGGAAIGYKVACTNAIAQEALRIDRPVFGQLLEATTHDSPVELAADRFTRRVVEAEFGVRMGRTVAAGSGPHTAASIVPHVGQLLPSIEVVDHRFVDWSVGALSVAADNAIHGCWVRGPAYEGDWTALDLARLPVTVTLDGEVVTTGSGEAVLGHPLNVVAWLADELPRFGRQLRAGDWITTGVCTDVFEADAGSTTTADFGPLGQVTITWA
jgi:2-keto-4-pentenoate hydratase